MNRGIEKLPLSQTCHHLQVIFFLLIFNLQNSKTICYEFAFTEASNASPRASPSKESSQFTSLNVSSMQEAADVNQDFGANKNVKTLNLRLEEVAHIRSVLTKAELEAMAIDSAMRDSIARGKVWRLLLETLRRVI